MNTNPAPEPPASELRYLLIQRGESSDPTAVTTYATKAAREMATLFAIFGEYESVNGSHELEMRTTLEVLAEHGRLDFEGDPSIEWLDAYVENAPTPTGKESDAQCSPTLSTVLSNAAPSGPIPEGAAMSHEAAIGEPQGQQCSTGEPQSALPSAGSETPRTDAALTTNPSGAKIARILERELTTALANQKYGWETAREAHKVYEAEHKELTAARAELETARAQLIAVVQHRDQLRADLARVTADAKRLDWKPVGFMFIKYDPLRPSNRWTLLEGAERVGDYPSFRAAIDAASQPPAGESATEDAR